MQKLAAQRTGLSTSSDMVCERSPLATAPITARTSVDGCTRSPIRLFTDSTLSAPCTPHRSDGGALGNLALFTNGTADTPKLDDHLLVEVQDVVEGVGNLARHAGSLRRAYELRNRLS